MPDLDDFDLPLLARNRLGNKHNASVNAADTAGIGAVIFNRYDVYIVFLQIFHE